MNRIIQQVNSFNSGSCTETVHNEREKVQEQEHSKRGLAWLCMPAAAPFRGPEPSDIQLKSVRHHSSLPFSEIRGGRIVLSCLK